jgi:hypothetical protein
MSENFLLSWPHLGLSECQRSDNASQVTQGAESIMWLQYYSKIHQVHQRSKVDLEVLQKRRNTNQLPINGPHVPLITVGSQGTIGAISSLCPLLWPSWFILRLGFQQRIRLGFDNKYGVLFENHSRFLVHSRLHRMRLMMQINMSKSI